MTEIKNTFPPYSDDNTSLDAAESKVGSAQTERRRVLEFIREGLLHGATDDEVEVALDMPHQTASARRNELMNQGLVIDSGGRRKTRSGRYAKVWVTPQQGNLFHAVPPKRKGVGSLPAEQAKYIKRLESFILDLRNDAETWDQEEKHVYVESYIGDLELLAMVAAKYDKPGDK